GARVQVERISLLLSIASALPGKHCPLVSGGSGGGARFAKTPVAVCQKGTGDLGYAVVEEREDEQLVPKDVALIRLSGPTASRYANIEADRVERNSLQQVKHVQVKQHRDVQLKF